MGFRWFKSSLASPVRPGDAAYGLRAMAVMTLVAAFLALFLGIASSFVDAFADPGVDMMVEMGVGMDLETWSRTRAQAERDRARRITESERDAAWLALAALACAGLALAGMTYSAWRTRRDVRSWHWRSFASFALLGVLGVLTFYVSRSRASTFGLLAVDLGALALAMIDLRRKRYRAPGRVVAWLTLGLALVIAYLLIAYA